MSDDRFHRMRTRLNEGGPPRLIIELHPPEREGDEPIALITERDERLSSFMIAMMLQSILKEYTASAERERLRLAKHILTASKPVELSESIQEALMDRPSRWGHLEIDGDEDR